MNTSIRTQLLVWQIGALLLTGLLASLLTYALAWSGFNRLRDYGLEQIAYSVMRHDTQELIDSQTSGNTPDSELSNDQGQFISQIWSSNGQLIYASDTEIGPGLQAAGLHHALWEGERWTTMTIADGDRWIQVATPVEHRWRGFLEFVPWLLLPLVLLIALLSILIHSTVQKALQPLQQLRNELSHRDGTQLTPLPAQDMPVEVQPLVDTLNQLLAKVDGLLHQQRQFLADVAHELNTPLAAIKLQAQLTRRSEPAQRTAALDELEAGIERAVHLVAQLLQMARLEPEAQRHEREPVDVQHVARNAVMALSAQADGAGIDLGLVPLAAPQVQAHPQALRVLLDNLIDNALRYCPSGSRVDVRISTEGDAAVLEVADNGPGIPDSDKPRVLQRFVRLHPSDTLGSGLGLAIARQIAEQHQGQVSLHDSPGGGLTVRVALPLLTTSPGP